MIYKRPSALPGKVHVTFQMPAQFWAETVALVGDFNNWDQWATMMTQDGPDGCWQAALDLDEGREYQFRYVADGQYWHNDGAADKYVANEHGTSNSVVVT